MVESLRQFGGRKGRSTFDANTLTHNLKSIASMTNQHLHVLSIDITKAFYSIPMELIQDSLSFFGIEDDAIQLILEFINNTPTIIKINNTKSDSFNQESGMKQGDTLSPLIFILGLDYILQHLETRIINW